MAVQGHDEGNGVLCDGVRRVGRDSYDPDSEILGGSEINVVESCAAQGNEPDAIVLQDAEDLPVAGVVDEDADRLCAGCKRRVLRSEVAAVVQYFKAELCVDLLEHFPVIGMGSVKGYFVQLKFSLFAAS